MSVSGTETGRELIVEWHELDTRLAAWILKLADFDRDQLYRVDGFNSCASWLEIKCEMARSTAFEKVHFAHELTRRPKLRDAFAQGSVAYAKARAISRLDGVDDERDASFIADAAQSSVRALEARVRNWNYLNGRERYPDLDDHYGMFREPGFMDGLGRLVLEGTNDMLDRVVALADAYGNYLFHNGDRLLRLHPVDKSSARTPAYGDDHVEHSIDCEPKRSLAAKRLDHLLDLLEEVALVNDDKIDPEVASIGVTVQYEDLIENRRGLVPTDQESLITGEAARRLACDAGINRMVLRGVSEFLDIGRKTRTWTTAQRRAIRARHNHRCAAAGCNRRITQIHHIHWWEDGGVTSIDNGVPLCSYHHHLVHEGGWTISYNPRTGVTRLEGPEGQVLETQVDVGRRQAA